MKKILIAVDLQKDFVDGALGTAEAVKIIPSAKKKIEEFSGDRLFITYDTHYSDYMNTLEGKKLPVPHCIEGTEGHALNSEIAKAVAKKPHTDIIKNTFGTFEIAEALKKEYPKEELKIELIGLCTDICVLSNAIILRAEFPNAEISVDAACCAGVTPEKHCAALEAMSSCQIDII